MMASKSARAVCRHSTSGTPLPFDQRLCIVHDLFVRRRRSLVFESFLHLGAEPRVIGICVDRQAGWEAAFLDDAGQQNTHGIGDGKSEVGELFRRDGLEFVIYADVEHRSVSHGDSFEGPGKLIVYLIRDTHKSPWLEADLF